MTSIRVKRIYEPPEPDDGRRVLVDRIWPRGMSHERAALEAWMPDVAPSDELRKWYDHEPARWDEFQARYRAELVGNPHVDELTELTRGHTVTLLFSARDTERNQAVALAAFLGGHSEPG